jgi:hypothetical protein
MPARLIALWAWLRGGSQSAATGASLEAPRASGALSTVVASAQWGSSFSERRAERLAAGPLDAAVSMSPSKRRIMFGRSPKRCSDRLLGPESYHAGRFALRTAPSLQLFPIWSDRNINPFNQTSLARVCRFMPSVRRSPDALSGSVACCGQDGDHRAFCFGENRRDQLQRVRVVATWLWA